MQHMHFAQQSPQVSDNSNVKCSNENCQSRPISPTVERSIAIVVIKHVKTCKAQVAELKKVNLFLTSMGKLSPAGHNPSTKLPLYGYMSCYAYASSFPICDIPGALYFCGIPSCLIHPLSYHMVIQAAIRMLAPCGSIRDIPGALEMLFQSLEILFQARNLMI